MSTSARFTNDPSDDNTFRVLTHAFKEPDYAATINVTTLQSLTYVKPGALTGNLTINVGVGSSSTAPYKFDKLVMMFEASGATRTVTFGTGLAVSAATQDITDGEKAVVEFIFDGTEWVESNRSVEA